MENNDPDWIKENMPDNTTSNDLPEAPASATIRVYIDGYSTLLTMRSTKVKDVIAQTEYIVNYAKTKGWKTTWDKELTQTPNEDLDVCKNCGAKNLRSQKGKIYCSAKCWLKEGDK